MQIEINESNRIVNIWNGPIDWYKQQHKLLDAEVMLLVGGHETPKASSMDMEVVGLDRSVLGVHTKQDGSAFSEWCLSFLIILTYLVAIPTAKKCRSVEQLTNSAVSISPYFLDYWSYSQSPHYNCIDNPASCIQSLFPTGQR